MTIAAAQQLLATAEKNIANWRRSARDVKRVGIIHTSWYPDITAGLLDSANEVLAKLEIDPAAISRVQVSGVWELPLAVQQYIAKDRPAFTIALGCVVRGETPHFDILCQTVSEALMRLQLEQKAPIGFGVLTVNSIEQAQLRMAKGAEAAEAAFRSWLALRAS